MPSHFAQSKITVENTFIKVMNKHPASDYNEASCIFERKNRVTLLSYTEVVVVVYPTSSPNYLTVSLDHPIYLVSFY